jgi:protein-disulfide isomerase
MNSAAQSTYNIPGTPAFLINGTLVEQVAAWSQLEPKIKEALAG